jgi:acyl carrier protein
MYQEEKIIDLIITMIEQSNDRMKEISKKNQYGEGIDSMDMATIRLAQREFEMQIKLLDRIIKDFKGGKGIFDITPATLQKRMIDNKKQGGD